MRNIVEDHPDDIGRERSALQTALDRVSTSRLVEKQRKGYAEHPVTRQEFAGLEEE
jgi:hypothetical protein